MGEIFSKHVSHKGGDSEYIVISPKINNKKNENKNSNNHK